MNYFDFRDWQDNPLVPGITYWVISEDIVSEKDIMDYLISKGATEFDPEDY